jgi:protein-tyrosine phosphatase
MAELLCRKRIADRLGCKIGEVEDRGIIVMSSGLAAEPGGRPTAEAVQAMSERGLDLTGHASQPISDRLIRHADVILTMTKAHRQTIVGYWPEAGERTFTLNRDQSDIADPIGAPRELYRRCAEQIDAALGQRVDEFEI